QAALGISPEPLLERWLERFDRFEHSVRVRVLLAAARHAIDRNHLTMTKLFLQAEIASVEDWLSCPCEAHARDARSSMRAVLLRLMKDRPAGFERPHNAAVAALRAVNEPGTRVVLAVLADDGSGDVRAGIAKGLEAWLRG